VLATAYLLSALTCAVVAVVSWRRRHLARSATALTVVMAGLTWWSLVDLAASFAPTATALVSLQLAIYPGVGAVCAGFACLCWSLADHEWQPSRRTALLLVEPLAISVAAATNSWHHLVVSPSGELDVRSPLGPLFWAHTAYSYALLGSALLLVLRVRRHTPALQTRQLTVVLCAALLPIAPNVATLAGLTGRYDVSALAFAAVGLVDAHVVLRMGLFEVIPVARARVLEGLQDAVFVLDEQERLSDANRAGRLLVERASPPGDAALGRPAGEAFGGLVDVLLGEGGEHAVALRDGAAHLDVQCSALGDRRGRHLGRVLVVRDISAAIAQRRLLADANAALHEQVAVVERLRAEVAEQAVRDPLTGLHNRRHLTRVLDQQVRAAHDTGEPLSVVLLDVDHFKSVNDRYGHAVGDRLLQTLAGALRSAVQPAATVARYGGEEFVLVLPLTGSEQALAVAEQAREACRAVAVPVRDGLLHVTLSAGVATTGPLADMPDALVEAADQALYRAKATGRDRTVGVVPAAA